MIKPISAKLAAVALLATTAACSCIKAPDLDVAPAAVSKKYEDTGYKTPMVKKQAVASGNLNKSKAAVMAMPLDRVFFGFDSAVLTPAAQSALRDVAAYVKAKNIKNMVVEGHCDERGTREYNLALGDRRAVSIKRFLVSLGVDGRGITTVSYGKERPAEMGHNQTAWSKNRRGVIMFK